MKKFLFCLASLALLLGACAAAPTPVSQVQLNMTAVPEPKSSPAAIVNFVAEVPACYSINGDWQKAFAQGQVYQVVPGRGGLPSNGSFVFFEGVVAASQPKDLHSVFEVTKAFAAEQGNFWNCGPVTDNSVKTTILFQSADKKWQNLTSQKLAHPIRVIDAKGTTSDYASGEKPLWALGRDDTSMVCPYTDKPYQQNPAGVIQPDGTFVGAIGKAGCDFVAILPDGKAFRFEGAKDSFHYTASSRFFLFTPSLTNEAIASALNLGKILPGE